LIVVIGSSSSGILDGQEQAACRQEKPGLAGPGGRRHDRFDRRLDRDERTMARIAA
jgi:hypothetical protein